jgi:tetratricopeptide (TPR) repeat protein
MMKEKTAEAVAIMEEMLELNEHDNQGVRFTLLSALILLGDTEKFKKYDEMFADDKHSASILYSRALFAFKTEGNSANARKMLKEAFKANRFVVQQLIDDNSQITGIEAYSPGSPEEAQIYVDYAFLPWHETEGAMEWLLNMVVKMLAKK